MIKFSNISRSALANASRRKQEGVTLIIALIFLVIFTLLVFSGVTSGILSYRMAADMQHQREAVAAAQSVIDSRLGNKTCLTNPADSTCSGTVVVGSYSVVLAAPKCLGIDLQEESGKKSQVGVAPIPKYLWEFAATASPTGSSGEAVTVTQGVKIEMDTGTNCPN